MAKVSIEELKKASKALKESIEFGQQNTSDKKIFSIARDASTLRFEFCVELSWKLSKKIMGSSSATAKPVVREMLQNGLIDNFDLWFDFIDARNKSSHTYDESIAGEVFDAAVRFIDEVDSLITKLSNP
jgi:nucleotidyltransferase substrate binding protein (TIGR01987 family)